MTNNQVQYVKYLEDQRHNRASEAAQELANTINAQHFQRMDAETARSNLARELENTRHNTRTEAIGADANWITHWYNQQQAELGQSRLSEELRHNLESERLTGTGQDVTRRGQNVGAISSIVGSYLRGRGKGTTSSSTSTSRSTGGQRGRTSGSNKIQDQRAKSTSGRGNASGGFKGGRESTGFKGGRGSTNPGGQKIGLYFDAGLSLPKGRIK